MAIVIDHTIVPARDRVKSAKFYERIFGFKDLGEKAGFGHLHPVRVNSSSVLFFVNKSEGSPLTQGTHHLAFYVDPRKFAVVFKRI